MTTDDFLQLREEILELFPTEDKDLFYTPHYKNTNNESVGPRGSLYSMYKTLRRLLKEGGLIVIDKKKKNSDGDKLNYMHITYKNTYKHVQYKYKILLFLNLFFLLNVYFFFL